MAEHGTASYREDILEGIGQMPRAFLRLLRSENLGKQLVRLVWASATVPDSGPRPSMAMV